MSAAHQGGAGPEGGAPCPQAVLGAEIRRLRRLRGLSQRALVKMIGLTAHSNLSDYESGRRLPPADIVAACERALEVADGYLQGLRGLALADRAGHARGDRPGPGTRSTAAAPRGRTRRWMTAAGIACLLAAAALAAAGQHRAPMTEVSGVVHVGDHVATMVTGGWAYGFSGGGVSWVDSRGSFHDSGWPACLRGPGLVRATFGVVPVTYPDGQSQRQVVWVDCQR